MTQPESIPQLAPAIVDTSTDPTVTRIGLVTAVGPGTNLTVRISGSDVLINAAYLITYQPVIGDVVAVTRQGAAWLCLGTFNLFGSSFDGTMNPVVNPSFEDGAAGSPTTPNSWTLFHDAASTATAISEVTANSASRDGSQFWDIILVGVGTSTDTLASTAIPVATGQIWSAAAWTNGARTAVAVTGNAILRLGWYASDADPIGTTIAVNTINNRSATTIGSINYYEWTLLREGANATGFEVPAGANWLRVQLRNVLTNTAGNAVVNTWDAVSARRIM